MFETHKKMRVPESRPATSAPVGLVEVWEDNCESAAVDVNLLGIDDDSDDETPPAEPAELSPLRLPAENSAFETRISHIHGVTHHLWSKTACLDKKCLSPRCRCRFVLTFIQSHIPNLK